MNARPASLYAIARAVSAAFGFSLAVLRSNARNAKVTRARRAFWRVADWHGHGIKDAAHYLNREAAGAYAALDAGADYAEADALAVEAAVRRLAVLRHRAA